MEIQLELLLMVQQQLQRQGEALQVLGMWNELQHQHYLHHPPAPAHRGMALQATCLWEGLKLQLIAHYCVHFGERPYKCPECWKKFWSCLHLIEHQWMYTEERSYECPKCGKRFWSSLDLIKHQQMHRGEALPLHRLGGGLYP